MKDKTRSGVIGERGVYVWVDVFGEREVERER